MNQQTSISHCINCTLSGGPPSVFLCCCFLAAIFFYAFFKERWAYCFAAVRLCLGPLSFRSFSSEVAHTENKFGIQIYRNDS